MKAVIFDLGDTLVEYAGLPLSWVDHYPAALRNLARAAGTDPDEPALRAAIAVLERHNTRLHPRETEVSFAAILAQLGETLGVRFAERGADWAEIFFAVFRQRLRCFADAPPALARLRQRGVKIGVFTDVPYGMPRTLVLADVRAAGLHDACDVLLTSHDVGWRKPAPATLAAVAQALGCGAREIVHVGNERKDIDVARRFGCESVLLDRAGVAPAWSQDRRICSLDEL